uniref:AlNc14C2478G13245 protein n=1 Tax=Albugo laibachii Nc14 TaxID=890382 RepID=F0X2Y4_9STRA|nr:AlNc14C2478G13245 [Albugo laibachii Nc14]|eukprot:CCA28349.1 AlNc14C2478G13245 [Albugo laibachii Nc14]
MHDGHVSILQQRQRRAHHSRILRRRPSNHKNIKGCSEQVFQTDVRSRLEIKDLGVVKTFLGLQISLDEEVDYVLDQEVLIDLLLNEYGLETANGVRALIAAECNNYKSQEPEYIAMTTANGDASVKISVSGGKVTLYRALYETGYMFCSTQGDSTSSQAYYGRLEDGEAYFKVLEGDQDVKVADRRRWSIVW